MCVYIYTLWYLTLDFLLFLEAMQISAAVLIPPSFFLLPHTCYVNTYRACAKERLEVVQCLLQRSSSEPLSNLASNESPLHVTCEKCNHKIVSALLEHSPRLMFIPHPETSMTPLHIACKKGDLEMVKIICKCFQSYINDVKEEDNSPPDMKDKVGHTPFFIACSSGHIEIVRELCQLKEDLGKKMTLDVNARVSDTNRTSLHAAIINGSFETVHLLLTLEDTNINVEARPSPTTHEKFLSLIEMKRHGRLLLSHESSMSLTVQNDTSSSPPDASLSSTSVPSHFATMGPDDYHNAGGGGGRGTHPMTNTGYSSKTYDETDVTSYPKAYAYTSSLSNFTVPAPRKFPSAQSKSRPIAPAIRPISELEIDSSLEADSRALGIFLTQREELVVGKKDRTGGMAFNQLMFTPLAEACALGYNEIAEELLSYGAYDTSGLACRIAHLAQSYDTMHHILARCCTVVKERVDRGTSTMDLEPRVSIEQGLHLAWNGKRLPEVKGEWFTDSTVYYLDNPQRADSETEDVEASEDRNLRRVKPLCLRQLTLSAMPIRELNLSKNNLKSLPLQVFQLEHLTELLVQNNRIVELPEAGFGETWKCTRLELVNLSYNNLLHLPACLWLLPNLRKICVSHNNISTFSDADIPHDELSKALTFIDLSSNCIGPELPQFFFEFSSLRKAYFSKNKLSHLPDTIWQCPTLQELILSHNELVSLPWCDSSSETVSRDSAMGGYSILQQSDQVLTGVVQVKPNLSGNPYSKPKSSLYRSIKPSGGELSWVNYCAVNTESYDYSQLWKLDVSKNKLKEFPEALPCLAPNLTELIISHNPIGFIDLHYIPQSMKKLVCRNCEIELVGNVISADKFKQVVRNCRYPLENYQGKPCQHRNHPRLNQLTTFNLSQNRIKHFQLIHRHPTQQQLGRDPGNQPREKAFQASLSSLELLYPALENLDLSRNNLHDLFNPNIGHQSHLKSIKLNDNPELERIPYQFSCLRKSKDFTELTMANLPKLYEPPVEYQAADLSHIFTFMRSSLKE